MHKKTYDTTPITDDSYYVDLRTLLADGERIDSVKINGIQLEPGSLQNFISNTKIIDSKGEKTTYNYDITYVPGTLTVM